METSRVHFDKILKKYKEYIELYKYFNDGSAQGATTFDVFYRRFTYFVKYQEHVVISH